MNIQEYLEKLPLNITHINLSSKKLKILPDLSRFIYLTELICSDNELTFLPKLNSTIKLLDCCNNKLTSIYELPNNLYNLQCADNNLIYLPKLNNNLKVLNCSYNNLLMLPDLNENLEYIY